MAGNADKLNQRHWLTQPTTPASLHDDTNLINKD
jgi:hypothetical protein